MSSSVAILGQIQSSAQQQVLGADAGGFSLWQTLGGLVLVFGLLILCLRLLSRFNRRRQSGNSALMAVWSLGPRREIQVLKLADQVHYIYRHDGAMVLLKQESLADWQQAHANGNETTSGGAGSLARIFTGEFGKFSFLRGLPAEKQELPAGQ